MKELQLYKLKIFTMKIICFDNDNSSTKKMNLESL